MARFLVTGGAGFIGSHLAAALRARGDQVVILDDFTTGKRANLERVGGGEAIEGSITDPPACARAVDGVDYVLHQAALPSVPRSIADPVRTDRVNLAGTLNLLTAARDAGVRRFVFASSSSVYGETAVSPKVETLPPAPRSPYAITKATAEQYCQAFHRFYGLETICLRYFNVYGPGQDPDSPYAAAIPIFIRRLCRGASPVVYGDGEQSRDFTHVANVVAANLAACGAPVEAAGEVFNCACGQPVALRHVAALIQRQLGTDLPLEHAPERPGDIRHSHADIGKARTVLGYAPVVGLEAGLPETVEWYRSTLA